MAVLGIRSGLYASPKPDPATYLNAALDPASYLYDAPDSPVLCCGSGMFFRIPDPILSQPESLIPDAHQRI